jgi:hypothetical protein
VDRKEKWPPRCIAKPGVTKAINRRAALRHQPDEAAGSSDPQPDELFAAWPHLADDQRNAQ